MVGTMQTGSTLQQIYAAAMEFLEPISLQQSYETITQQAVKLVDGIDGFICLSTEKSSHLNLVYSSSDFDISPILKSDEAYVAFRKKMAVVVHNEQSPVVFIPLFYQKKSLGTLLIRSNEANDFDENDLDALKVFGSMATLAIRKAQLYQQNQTALKVRDLFISMATHELKTPLTSIIGYVQLLASKMQDQDTREAGWVKTLTVETKRLSDLINEMQQTYSIKSGKLAFSWTECHVRDILQKSIDAFSRYNSERVIDFRNLPKDKNDLVIGDCDKLQKVFENIIENAEKFSRPDTPILVELYEEGAYLLVDITDRGKGIPKSELPFVFDEFYKGKENHTTSGIGLGLYFVKSILTQHHGKIQISSSKKGTRVSVRLKKVEL